MVMVNDDECAVCICMSVFLCVGVFCFVLCFVLFVLCVGVFCFVLCFVVFVLLWECFVLCTFSLKTLVSHRGNVKYHMSQDIYGSCIVVQGISKW